MVDDQNPEPRPKRASLSLLFRPKRANRKPDFKVDGRSPFLAIWTRPRRTIRCILDYNPSWKVNLLICVVGVGRVLDRACAQNAGNHLSLEMILGMALTLGPFVGLLSFLISSYFVYLTGRWIKGQATQRELRTAMAWSAVPEVFSVSLWFPLLLLVGSDMFTSATPKFDAQPSLRILFFATMFVGFVMRVWGFILLCHTTAEVQQFKSVWAGLGNLLLSLVLGAITLLIVAVGVVGMTMLFRS